MLTSIGVLVEIRGIVRLMEQLVNVHLWVKDHTLTKTTLWQVAKTLLAHKAWRRFPLLAIHLPEILLGATLRGVPLQDQVFAEPLPRGANRGLPQVDKNLVLEKKLEGMLARRAERYNATVFAIDELIRWARHERHNFLVKVVGCSPLRNSLVGSVEGLPVVVNDLALAADGQQSAMCDAECDDDVESWKPLEAQRTPALGVQALCDRAAADDRPGPPVCSETRMDVLEFAEAALSLEDSIVKLAAVPHLKNLWNVIDAVRKLAAHDEPKSFGEGLVHCDASSDDEVEDCSRMADAKEKSALAQPVARSGCGGVVACFAPTASEDIGGRVGNVVKEPLTRPRTADLRRCSTGLLKGCVEISKEELAVATPEFFVLRKLSSGKITASAHDRYVGKLAEAVRNGLSPRQKFLDQVSVAFGGEALFEGAGPSKTSIACAAEVCQAVQASLWNLPQIPNRVLIDPPQELFTPCSTEEFVNEYIHFCEWVRSFRDLPYGCEFHIVSGYVVQRVGKDNNPVGSTFFCSRVSVLEATTWGGNPLSFMPRVGRIVTSVHHGRCRVLEVKWSANTNRIYQHVMTTELAEVRHKQQR